MNVFTFSGNIGSDAEQRFTQSGTGIVQFSVAVTSGYGEKKATTWVRCSLFGKRGESLMPYLVKGQQVVVSGETTLREWTAKDGSKGSSLEVRVNDVTLVGGKPEARPARQQESQPAAQPDFDDGDLPF